MLIKEDLVKAKINNMKKKYDFHITPNQIIDEMVKLVDDFDICFEPYAGTGVILDKLKEKYPNKLYYYSEIQEDLNEKLEDKYYSLGLDADDLHIEYGFCDLVISNPPFTDIKDYIGIADTYVKLNGTIILLLPSSIYTIIDSYLSDFEIIEKKELGIVDFDGTKTAVFILKAKRIKVWRKDYKNIVSEIPLSCTTEFGKGLLKILFDYYGFLPKAVTKFNWVTKYYSTRFEKDLQEWRLFLYRAKEPIRETNAYNWCETTDDEFSVFFKKDYIPTLDDIIEQGCNYFLNHWNVFEDTQQDYESFILYHEDSQEYLDLYYEEMPKLEELRTLTYRLYQDSKVLRSFRFNDKRIMRDVMDKIHELEYQTMNK